MALLLQVADNGVAAEVPRLKDLPHLTQVFLLESQLEQVVRVVNFLLDELSLSVEGEDQVLHEEGHVLGFVQGFERP